MSKSPEKRASRFIIGVGVLSAVAVLLVPGLFEEFRTGRLVAIIALIIVASVFAIAAKHNLKRMVE